MAKSFKDKEHVTFLLVKNTQADQVVASCEAAGLSCVYRRPLSDPPKPPFITDFTWNHTTLWAMKSDPRYTYIQAGFSANFQEQFAERVIYIKVADLQQTLDAAVAAGGKVILPPTRVPGVVYFALFEDPAGNRTGLIE